LDNLTHSLVGALIGQMGLKRRSGLAMPTLIIAANIPDIDAVATLLGGHQHLAIRRGITHGPIAMLLLPLLLWGAMLAYDRWRPSERRLPVDKGWLLALAYIGCLSHPLFDWFNSYGIRLLEPFSSRWFYGDTLFIVDVWIWIALMAGVWLSLRREKHQKPNWRFPAFASFMMITAYISANGMISWTALNYAEASLRGRPALIAVNPVPFAFWRRDIFWQIPDSYGSGSFDLAGKNVIYRQGSRDAFSVPGVGEATIADSDAFAFLFWSRMPVGRIETKNGKRTLVLSDQRFSNPLVADRFTVRVPLQAKSGIE
jgi:inner membrane protein